ncbi:hypothetical protein ACFVDQ_42660 [Streptomyces sp. NPDC057684]|uniref:hypothetical protein n=1 Tax=Streptomyces sp. NPDC057684 TaxID=3346211 RepID=UPI0036B95FCD
MDEQKFADMAGQFVRASLDSWRAGNRAFAVLHAGVGCEHILKALLCHHDPLLISDRNDRAHRFHALGFGDQQGVKPLSEAKTIGIVEAFKDASVVMRGQMPVNEQTFRPVADSRNGVAHYAHHDDHVADRVVEVTVQVVEAVRAELDLDPADFWGEYETVFTDLAKIAAMPAQTGDRPSIEAAAEELALAERAAARAALTSAVAAADEVASWGSAQRPAGHQMDVGLTAVRTALMTGLLVTGARAHRAASELLAEYEVLPFPSRPDASHAVPGIEQKAQTAVAVKVLISSSVIAGLFDARAAHPDRPILSAMEEINDAGQRWSSPAPDGNHRWRRPCPACGFNGDVFGDLAAEDCSCPRECAGAPIDCPHPDQAVVVGLAESFSCPFCGLTLTHGEELEAAGIETGEI